MQGSYSFVMLIVTPALFAGLAYEYAFRNMFGGNL